MLSSLAGTATLRCSVIAAVVAVLIGAGRPVGQISRTAHIVVRHPQLVNASASWVTSLNLTVDAAVPLISDGTQVLVDTGSDIVSYSLARGKVQWRSKTGYTSPFTFYEGHVFCVDTLRNSIIELNSNNGRKVWSSEPIDRFGIEKMLVDADSIAVFNGQLRFINRSTRKAVVADSDGSETTFDTESSQQSGDQLFVSRATTGGPIVRDIGEYDQNTGKQTWQSNAATGFWLHAGNVIVVENANSSPPFYSYVPLTLDFLHSNIGPVDAPPHEAVFAPDPPARLSETTSDASSIAYFAWPNLFMLANTSLYRYDLRRSPDVQHPDRIAEVSVVLGMLDNGALLVPSEKQLQLIRFDGVTAYVAEIDRHVIANTSPFPTTIVMGSAAAISDATGTLLLFRGGGEAMNVSEECPHLVSAAGSGVDAIVLACAKSSGIQLLMFRAHAKR